jgi:hypothetical protein
MYRHRDSAAERGAWLSIAIPPFGWTRAAVRLGLVFAAIVCAAMLSGCGGSFVPDANAGLSPHGGYFGGS